MLPSAPLPCKINSGKASPCSYDILLALKFAVCPKLVAKGSLSTGKSCMGPRLHIDIYYPSKIYN